MFRKSMDDLVDWKNSKDRKPLIIRGARQVGKTWLMKEFGKNNYEKSCYINFDNNERMERLFCGDLDIKKIITALEFETSVKIEARNTLIIFDEVQEVPRALTSLKYFVENAPEYHIISAGSFWGVALHPGTSFPVGKVEFLNLYPLDFLEFLSALGNDELVRLLKREDFNLITSFKNKYIDLLNQYYYIGGMPAVVASFSENSDYCKVRQLQKDVLQAYEQDFSKHAPDDTVPRIRMLWKSIPAQLAKGNSNRKFKYGLIRPGARANEYELAMMWLIDCGLIHKVSRITKPDMPLIAYEDFNAFKLFVLDVGLLGAMSDLGVKSLLHGNKLFQEFKEALTEQYVLQQLISRRSLIPYYWSAEKNSAGIHFIFQSDMNIVPLGIKAAESIPAEGLKSYCQKYKPKYAICTSISDYIHEELSTNLPLYMINVLPNLLKGE